MSNHLEESLVDIRPVWLTRVPGDTKPIRNRARKKWAATPAMKEAIEKDRVKWEKLEARPAVRKAVKGGADTLGKIRKETGLETDYIMAALRFYQKTHAIFRHGKRYLWEG